MNLLTAHGVRLSPFRNETDKNVSFGLTGRFCSERTGTFFCRIMEPEALIFKTCLGLLLGCFMGSVASAQTHFAVLASDGAWNWCNDPRALFHNGILYFGYVRDGDGRSVLSAYNPQTGSKTDLWTSTLIQRDDYDNPGLLVKRDGTMLAIYARHG